MSFKIGDKVTIIGLLPLTSTCISDSSLYGVIIAIDYYWAYPYKVLIGDKIIKCLNDQIILTSI